MYRGPVFLFKLLHWDVRFYLILGVIEDQVERKAKHREHQNLDIKFRHPVIDSWHPNSWMTPWDRERLSSCTRHSFIMLLH